jgi:hypothetical protein
MIGVVTPSVVMNVFVVKNITKVPFNKKFNTRRIKILFWKRKATEEGEIMLPKPSDIPGMAGGTW